MRDEGKREINPGCPSRKMLLAAFSPGKRDVTKIEIQGGERRGEIFPPWTDVKSHIVEMIES